MRGIRSAAQTTRREAFLDEMNRLVPWAALCVVVEPYYPKRGNGRPPIALERMLRIHFVQHWFNLADLACEEALYDSLSLRLAKNANRAFVSLALANLYLSRGRFTAQVRP